MDDHGGGNLSLNPLLLLTLRAIFAIYLLVYK
jgi:hypothetical protein